MVQYLPSVIPNLVVGSINDVVNKSTDLRALLGGQEGETVLSLGLSAPGDNAGGLFRWDLSGTFSDNNVTSFKPDDYRGTGRWVRTDRPLFTVVQGFGDGVRNDFASIQATMLQAATYPGSAVFFPAGVWTWPWTFTIIVPSNTTVFGVRGQSILRATITDTIPTAPAFPFVGGAMMHVGNPVTGKRYASFTSRAASGNGATFNLTFVNGVVTAATVVAGGTGYKAGDTINLAGGTFSTRASLTVSTTTGFRGPVTAVTVNVGGNYSVQPANPVAQSSSLGQADSDIIYDTTTFADNIHFRNLVFDGNYDSGTGAGLTGSQIFYGLRILGVKNFSVEGCEFTGTPNTGMLASTCQTGSVTNNYGHNLGWKGAPGTSRNAISNIGIYNTTNPELNTRQWLVSNNRFLEVGDVSVQFAYQAGFVCSDNTITGFGSIGIEGEASGFAINDSSSVNGGIEIPASCTISNNRINGTCVTQVSQGLDGISISQGNEGKIFITNNTVRATQRFGVAATQQTGGTIQIWGNTLDAVNTDAANRLQALFAQADYVSIKNNDITNGSRGDVIFVQQRGLQIEILNNKIDKHLQSTTGPAIHVDLFRGAFNEFIRISGNDIRNVQADAILVESVGVANPVSYDVVDISDNILSNFNRGGTGAQNFFGIKLTTRTSSTFDTKMLTIERNKFYENSLVTGTSQTPVAITPLTVNPIRVAVFKDNIGPDYASLFTITATTSTTVNTGNIITLP